MKLVRIKTYLKTYLLTIVIVLVGIVLSLILGESYMRTRFVTDFTLPPLNEECVLFVPNYVTHFEGNPYRIPPTTIITNSYGMRDINYTKEKQDNTIRIAVIGDSFVFGWGVELNETFVKVIEQNLKRTVPFDVQVMNFGRYGTSGMQKIKILEFASQFQPDVVVFQFWGNDLPIRSPLYEAEIDETEAEEYYINIIKIIHNISTEKNFSVIVVIEYLPPTPQQTEFVYEQCMNLGFTAVKIKDVTGRFPEQEIFISEHDKHWNAYGHRVMGEYLTPIVYGEIMDRNNR